MMLFARMANEKQTLNNKDWQDVLSKSKEIYDLYDKAKNPSQPLIKYSLFLAEAFSILGHHEDAADAYTRIATVLTEKA